MQRAFHSCHPAVNILFFASVLTFGMLFYHPVLLGIAFAFALGNGVLLCGGKALRTFLTLLLPTWILVAAVNTAFNHYGVTTLLVLPSGNRITLEAVLHGLAVGGMAVTVFLWFLCYNAVVTSDKFLHVFGRRLPTAALLVSMTLRFIPLFTRRLRQIRTAQRGIGNAGGSVRAAVREVGVLTAWSLENAVETADAMRARGYGLRGRTHYARYIRTRRDTLLSVWIVLADAAVLAGMIGRLTWANYNPCITLPEQTALSGVLYGVYALLCATPLLLERSEGQLWNRSA